MRKITNRHLINFLEENGVYPVVEDEKYDIAWYCRTDQLTSLLETYNIRYNYFKNSQPRRKKL